MNGSLLVNICSECFDRPLIGDSKKPRATRILPKNMIATEIIRISKTRKDSSVFQQHAVLL